jgi:hypothetical protein
MSTIEHQAELSHQHVPLEVRVLIQRRGVPYEIAQQVCATCHQVLDERPVRRADA